jgi:pyruvate dehydrogenase complex dehydrogenase (E1) component
MDKKQVDDFIQIALELGVNESDDALDSIMGRLDLKKKPEAKVCPECGHIFKGNGWDGVDAHWKSKHEAVMPYEDAWPLLKSGTYPA